MAGSEDKGKRSKEREMPGLARGKDEEDVRFGRRGTRA